MPGFIKQQVGTLYYNGFWFPPAITMTVRCSPVYDDRGVNVMYLMHTINVEMILHEGVDYYVDDEGNPLSDPVVGGDYEAKIPPATPGNIYNPIDAQLERLKNRLSTPHRPFLLTGKGIGTIRSGYDGWVGLPHGAQPQVLAWEPLGSNRTVRVSWSCEVGQALCGNATLRGRPLAYEYSIAYDVNEKGCVTRTISGYLRAAAPIKEIGTQTVVGNSGVIWFNKRFNYTAGSSDFWRWLQFDVPEGFQRLSQQRNITPDRSTLRFTFVDKEIESDNPYPDGVSKIDIAAEVRSGGPVVIGSARYTQTLGGSITMAKGIHRSRAWLAFIRIVQDRLWRSEFLKIQPTKEDGTTLEGGLVLINSLAIREDIYGRTVDFNISWTFMTDILGLMLSSGLWQPILPVNPEGTKDDKAAVGRNTWTSYKRSMRNVWQVGGVSQLNSRIEDDLIVGVCDIAAPTESTRDRSVSDRQEYKPLLNTEKPDPESSYLEYKIDVHRSEDSGRTAAKVLGRVDNNTRKKVTPKTVDSNNPQNNALSPGASATLRNLIELKMKELIDGNLERAEEIQRQIDEISAETGVSAGQFYPEQTQVRGNTTHRVSMTGHGIRVGYEIPTPQLLQYGGQVPIPIGKGHFTQSLLSYANGIPVYFAAWDFEYSLPGEPTSGNSATSPDPLQWPQGIA